MSRITPRSVRPSLGSAVRRGRDAQRRRGVSEQRRRGRAACVGSSHGRPAAADQVAAADWSFRPGPLVTSPGARRGPSRRRAPYTDRPGRVDPTRPSRKLRTDGCSIPTPRRAHDAGSARGASPALSWPAVPPVPRRDWTRARAPARARDPRPAARSSTAARRAAARPRARRADPHRPLAVDQRPQPRRRLPAPARALRRLGGRARRAATPRSRRRSAPAASPRSSRSGSRRSCASSTTRRPRRAPRRPDRRRGAATS